MARSKPIYSEGHDSSLFPQKGKRGKRRASSFAPPVNKVPPVPNTQVGFLPPNLSDVQRVNLRARQLLAEREVTPRHQVEPSGLPMDRLHPLPDHDLYQDLDVPDPRGEQGNQFAGPVNTIFPEVRGPQPTHTKTRILPEYAEHPPLPDFEHPSQVNASKELIAAVSAEDQLILAFDNELSVMHTTLRRLRQKAERMAQSVSQHDDNPGQDNSSTSHAKNIVQLIATILEPWFSAVDDEFVKLLNTTEQGQALEEEAE